MKSFSLRVVWVTNLAAPYRLSVWRALSEMCNLEVWLLAANERNRAWEVPFNEPYRIIVLNTMSLRRGEATHYTARSQVASLVEGVDAIVLPSWENPAAWQLRRAGRRVGARLVGFNEATLMSELPGTLGRVGHVARAKFYRSLDAVVTVGTKSTELVLGAGVPRSRIFEGRNSVDVQMIRAEVAEARLAYSASKPSAAEPHIFVFVGQLIRRKRPDIAIEALSELGSSTASKLVIAGDGPLRAELVDLSLRLGLGDRVSFVGQVRASEVPKLLARCHTLVLPSSSEVWGLVVNEGLAAGLHVVVSSRCGVAPDVIGRSGVWVSGVERSAFSDAMAESLASWRGPKNVDESQFMPKELARVVRASVESCQCG